MRRNDDCVAQQIESTNKLLIQPYNDMIAALKNAGVVDVTMDTIKAIAKNGVEEIESLIPAIDETTTGCIRRVAERERETNTRNVVRCYDVIKGNHIYSGVAADSDEAIAMMQLDDTTGFVELSEAAQTDIVEICSEYISTPIGCKLYEMQQELAEKMQAFYDKLQEAKQIPNTTMSIDANAVLWRLFPLAAFHFKHDENDKVTVTPKAINFDPIANED